MESVTQRRARASPAGSLPELQGRGGGETREDVGAAQARLPSSDASP